MCVCFKTSVDPGLLNSQKKSMLSTNSAHKWKSVTFYKMEKKTNKKVSM